MSPPTGTAAAAAPGVMSQRRKKIALLLLALLLFSQAPFAYRRYQLGQLRAAIARLNAGRLPPAPDDPFDDHAGVVHVHSSLGGHSPGEPAEIVRAAKENGLAYVVMTEHPAARVNTAEATLRGTHGGVVFVGGSELVASGGERLFVAPGFPSPAPAADRVPARELLARARADGRLAAVAYPEEVRSWDFGGFDGLEVYNLYTNTKRINYARLLFDGIWSYWGYPDLLFATFYERPDAALRKWDELNAAGGARLAAYAGNDSHANVGVRLGVPGTGGGFEFKLDPYERSFRVVRNRVLLPKGTPPEAEAVLSALRAGRSYIAFDLFGDAGGFRLTADNGTERRTLGEEITLPAGGGALRLTARAPVAGRIVFFRDGRPVHEARDVTEAALQTLAPGAYRVEVYLDRLGAPLDGKPWIISNPIHVR